MLTQSLTPLNFRDLAGAPAGHRRLAPGRLFRTAHLSELSAASAGHLRTTLGVGLYLDFREDSDILRDGEPEALLACGVRWQRHPFDISDAAFKAIAIPRAADWRALYARAFPRLRRELAGAVQAIADADAPIAFGCWAGKDRTGMVTALLLSLLDVDDDWIAADFAKTGTSLLPAKDRFSFLWQDRPHAQTELIQAHLRTEPETILGFLSDVRREFGSVARALPLPSPVLARLSANYLEPSP